LYVTAGSPGGGDKRLQDARFYPTARPLHRSTSDLESPLVSYTVPSKLNRIRIIRSRTCPAGRSDPVDFPNGENRDGFCKNASGLSDASAMRQRCVSIRVKRISLRRDFEGRRSVSASVERSRFLPAPGQIAGNGDRSSERSESPELRRKILCRIFGNLLRIRITRNRPRYSYPLDLPAYTCLPQEPSKEAHGERDRGKSRSIPVREGRMGRVNVGAGRHDKLNRPCHGRTSAYWSALTLGGQDFTCHRADLSRGYNS